MLKQQLRNKVFWQNQPLPSIWTLFLEGAWILYWKEEWKQSPVSFKQNLLCSLFRHHLFPDVSFAYKIAWNKMAFQKQGFIMNTRVELCICPVTKGGSVAQVTDVTHAPGDYFLW